MKNPLVSAIIPTYNRANLIGRAIESAIAQSYSNLEIMVVDDASKDNTQEVINTIKDPRIRYIRHQTNCGGAAARNTGIDAATGEYVAFLDSDDFWLPNKLELQLSEIQNHPDSGKVVSYTQFKLDKGQEVSILPKRGKERTESVADYLFANGGEMLTSTLIMPRSLALATRFRPELKKHQDLDLCLRLEANGAIFTFIEEPLSIWYNDLAIYRISKILDYNLSLNWIQEYEGLISEKAQKGFLVKEVVPKLIETEQKKFMAARLLIDGALNGVVSRQKLTLLSARIILPKSLRQKLKSIGKKVFEAED